MDKYNIEPLENLLDEVRNIEGFPIAKDEDILALSDPPYYTACPNPYIKQFIEKYGKPYDPENDDYERKPFVGDISEGKNDPIYNAFSYHTKVPYKAIVKFIEHYTEPGDIVFDGFCGSGMTGIAAQIKGRNAILADLSPAATFIAYYYNNSIDTKLFVKEVKEIIDIIEKECGWMYETKHTIEDHDDENSKMLKLYGNTEKKGRINYTVWSDVFICPYCNYEYVYWDVAVDEKGKILKQYNCPNCEANLTKKDSKLALEKIYDSALGKHILRAKQVPVLINYYVENKRFLKVPDKYDLETINKIEEIEIPYWYPTERMPEGDESRRNDKLGIMYIHHFYTKRNLWILSTIWNKIKNKKSKILLVLLLINNSKMSRYGSRTGNVSGTLYVPSLVKELNVIEYLKRKLYGPKGIIKPLKKLSKELVGDYIISTNSITDVRNIPENFVDYIFTDPPFGDNLMYSELNFIWESWLRVFTNNKPEAIVNRTQNKSLEEYTELMTEAFKEMYRILKPNRWITVVFHNSKDSVWNAIQQSITKAGFIISQVNTMDKKQESFKQITSAGTVKNDLIINAYKPQKDFEEKFLKNAGEGVEVDFVKEHLHHLPIEPNIERTEKMLYSKMLAYYVERGYKIKYNASNFYTLLHDNFVELDGYWFLEEQINDYEAWKSSLKIDELKDIIKGNQVLFVVDEKSALIWLYNFLDEPKEYSEIFINYSKIITSTDDEIPELKELLDKNFILEDGKYRRPNTKEEKDKISISRERDLDKSWNELLSKAKSSRRKIRNVRKEAIVHGFTKCYQEENYEDILIVADSLYTSVLESNSDIMDFVDIARIKLGG